MKIKVENAFNDVYSVKLQVAQNSKWIDFGFMDYAERKELADQLREMDNELLGVLT